eukprot:sb/3460826/
MMTHTGEWPYKSRSVRGVAIIRLDAQGSKEVVVGELSNFGRPGQNEPCAARLSPTYIIFFIASFFKRGREPIKSKVVRFAPVYPTQKSLPPTPVRKSRRAKGLDPLNSSLKENETNNIPSGPKKKRKKTAADQASKGDVVGLVDSTLPEEEFMLPVTPPQSDQLKVEFVRKEKSLEEPVIPSDPDDPENSIPLANFVGCRSIQAVPERSSKLSWSHKRKEMKKNKNRCVSYTELERGALEKLQSPKVLKSKRRFVQHFNEFHEAALVHQCPTPAPSSAPAIPAKSVVSTKLVKRSMKHQICPKTKSSHITGVKRKRNEDTVKARFSKFFINEVVRLMVDNRESIWCMEILDKLIKTRQLSSSNVASVGSILVAGRDLVSFKLLISCTRSCSEKHLVELVYTIISDPLYSSTSCDGTEKETLDSTLSLLLSLPFDPSTMKRSLKIIPPSLGKDLMSVIGEKFIKGVPVKTRFSKFFINEVVRLMVDNRESIWCMEILDKLIKTRQLSSSNVASVGSILVAGRDLVSFKLLISCTRSCSEKHLVELVYTIISDPLYSSTSCDGTEKETLDSTLSLLLSLPFDPSTMKRSLKIIPPSLGKDLMSVIGEKFIKSVPVKSWKLTLSQWSFVRRYLSDRLLLHKTRYRHKAWLKEPPGEAGWVVKEPSLEAHPMGALVFKVFKRESYLFKSRFSKFFINEVVRLMVDNRESIWCMEILDKLIKTRQLSSSNVASVGSILVAGRDLVSFKLLISCTRSCSEKHLVELVYTIISDPLYSSTSCDGTEKETLDSILSLLLSLPFDPSTMKRSLKIIPPSLGKDLMSVIGEKFIKGVPVKSWKLTLSQVVQWCDVLVEVYFSALARETDLVRKVYNAINLHGGRTLVLTDSLSKFKADSISKNGLFIYNIESAYFRLFRHRLLLEFRLIWTLYLNLKVERESTVDLECSTRVRKPEYIESPGTFWRQIHQTGLYIYNPKPTQNLTLTITLTLTSHPNNGPNTSKLTYVDIESAFFRLFRHRVLLEFRLIWTLYLNLNLDIESTVDLECSTRVRPPVARPYLVSKREGLDKLAGDTHQPLTCWLQSQRASVREWLTKKPKVRQLLSKVKFITALSYFLISMKKYSMVPDISSFLPTLTSEQVKTEDTLPPLMVKTTCPTANKLFAEDSMYAHLHGGLVIGKDVVTLAPASPQLVASYDNIAEVAVQQNHKKLKGSGDGNLYPMAGDMVRIWGCDVNVRSDMDTGGPSPLHTAIKHGALECVYVLLGYHADLNLVDQKGWLPIHTASYYNQHLVVALLLSKDPTLIEETTQNKEELTPLLLAGSSGALDTVRALLDMGASATAKSRTDRGVIHLAALNRHVNVIELFIERNYPDLDVWNILVTMMKSEEEIERYQSVIALDTLTKKGQNWAELLEAKAIPALVGLLKPDPRLLPEEENSVARLNLKMQTSAVIRNISRHDKIRKAIAETNSIKTFIGLLLLNHDVVQSNAATIISDVCQVNDNAQKVAQEGGIVPVIQLLSSWLPTVLVSAMKGLCQLGANYEPNKEEIAKKVN